MKRKYICGILATIVCVCTFFLKSNIKISGNYEKETKSIWTEVSAEMNDAVVCHGDAVEFDLQKTVDEADFVFEGTVIDCKEYEVEWDDEDGVHWGPFVKSILYVEVDDVYQGQSPTDDNIIKVYNPYSISEPMDDSFMIEKNAKYVFVTAKLDEEFVEYRNANAPLDKIGQENYADVYIKDPCTDVMVIENDMVYVYYEYFCDDENIMDNVKQWEYQEDKELEVSDGRNSPKTFDPDLACENKNFNIHSFYDMFNNYIKNKLHTDENVLATDKIISDKLLQDGWFIALDSESFKTAFNELFE